MLKVIKSRRSIRRYTDRHLENQQVEQLVKAALMAPTSKNTREWEFIAVDDKELLNELSQSRDNGAAKFLAGAPLGIVILADREKSDVWVENASIAAAYIQLQAEHMDLGSCWIQVRNRMYSEDVTIEVYIKEKLNIPDKYSIECIIAVGYPDESKKEHDDTKLDLKKLHYNKL